MTLDYHPKINSLHDLLLKVDQWKSNAERIVFTNGCFDLIHLGHIDYLTKASALGDRLIVGLNSDYSVQRLKGLHRPIQNEQSRSAVMAALGCVDAVILFSEDTPATLIHSISPDILVKGGDWMPDQIVGAAHVLSYQGQVMTIPYIPGYSTSLIEHKIKSL